MPSGMFGAPVGISQKLADSDRQAQTAMKILEGAGELSLLPEKRQKLQAEAQLNVANAEKAEAELNEQRILAQELQKAGVGGAEETDDPAILLMQAGLGAVRAGATTKGREFINLGSQLQTRRATAEHNIAQADRLGRQIIADEQKRVGAMAGGMAADQRSYEAGLMQLAGEGINVADFPAAVEEARPLLKQLAEGSMTSYQRERLRQHDENIQLRTRELETLRGPAAQVLNDLRETQRELTAERRRRLARTPIGGPPREIRPDDIREVGTRLKELGIKMTPEGLNNTARDIASEARARVKANPALGISQAIQQVLDEEKEAGSFQDTPGWRGWLGEKTYVPRRNVGRTPETAITKVPPAPSSRQIGKWYRTPRGIYQWTQEGWVVDPAEREEED